MQNGRFRVGLVGCGAVSPNHLSALANIDTVEIAALCDKRREKAEASAKRFAPNADAYTDYLLMLGTAKLDAVHICTPHYLHAEMAIMALERNVNVFLEKPMCMSRTEIEALLEAEKKSQAKISVCFQNRFNKTVKIAEQLAEADGGVITGYGTVFWLRDEKYYTGSDWRGKIATEGGGAMINQAIHTVDLLCHFLGKPVSLTATTANHHLKGIIEVEDSCEGRITFESGRFANFYATTSFNTRDCTELCLITKNHKIDIREPYIYLDGKAVDNLEIEDAEYVGKMCYGHGNKYIIADFYDALINGCPMPVTLESAQYALRIILAAYASNDEVTDI